MMKDILKKTKAIINENLSLNLLVVGFLFYIAVMSAFSGDVKIVLLSVAFAIFYVAGAMLGKIRKYLPVIISILAIIVFLVAIFMMIIGKGIGMGFVVFGTVIIFYAITAYDSTIGVRSLPYCIAMFGAECVFCFNGDTRGMIVLVAALLLSVMFTNATYTAMSKYIFALFLAIAVLKCTGIWHIIKGTEATGMVKDFMNSSVLYIAMVVLGIVSLLLRERHPRIKSDRDKKHVPVLKQWQAVIGFSMIILVFWGLTYVDAIFEMDHLTGISADMRMNLVYVATIKYLGDSAMTSILSAYGFVPLMFFTMMIISFIYKAYANFRFSHMFADKLLLLMMSGFFVCFAYFGLNVPVTLLYAVLAGCVVNGSYVTETEGNE